jgi:hypothetical protein
MSTAKDERVDLVRPCRMGRPRGEPAPKVHDRYIAADRDDADQLICERRIPVDRFMNRFVKANDLCNAPNVVREPIYEGRVVMEKRTESRHIMSVPG